MGAARLIMRQPILTVHTYTIHTYSVYRSIVAYQPTYTDVHMMGMYDCILCTEETFLVSLYYAIGKR